MEYGADPAQEVTIELKRKKGYQVNRIQLQLISSESESSQLMPTCNVLCKVVLSISDPFVTCPEVILHCMKYHHTLK